MDYHYFKHYIHDQQLRNTLVWTRLWLKDKDQIGGHYHSNMDKNALFSVEGDPFVQLTLIVLASMIAVIAVFGFFFEIHRRRATLSHRLSICQEKRSGTELRSKKDVLVE